MTLIEILLFLLGVLGGTIAGYILFYMLKKFVKWLMQN